MPYKERETVRLFYSIGEVAERFGVNTSLIRFYEKEFDILKPHKNKKGNRLFTQADVDNLSMIFHLVREKGHTLASAKEIMLKGEENEDIQKLELINRLKRIRGMLAEIQGRLSKDQ